MLPADALKTVELVLAVGQNPSSKLAILRLHGRHRKLPDPTALRIEIEQGMALAWKVDSPIAPQPIKVIPARLQLRRHVRKYAEGELEPERSFYFRGPEGKLNLRAKI